MATSPAFQIYPNDWLGSASIQLMSAEQERGYLRLLFRQWQDPTCTLPDDQEKLSKWSLMGEGWFKGGSDFVLENFEPHPTLKGRIYNKRLYKEFEKQAEWRRKSAEGGVKSAASRRSRINHHSTTLQPPFKGGSQMVPTKGQPKGNIAVFSFQSSDITDLAQSDKVKGGSRVVQPTDSPSARGNIELSEAQKNRVYDLWLSAFKSRHRIKYKMTGKDWSAVKSLGEMFKDDERKELREIFKLYLQDQDKYLVSLGWPLAAILDRINRYRKSAAYAYSKKQEDLDNEPVQATEPDELPSNGKTGKEAH